MSGLHVASTREKATHVIFVRVHGLCVEPVLALLPTLFHMFADPDVAVQPEDEVHAARQRDEVRLETADEDRGDRH